MKRRKSARCDVALLVDEETGEYGHDGRFIPEDDDVEEKVLRALRKRYRRVEVVPFSPRVTDTIAWLRKLKPRIVMNLTEWVDGDRQQDAAIAGLLELLKLRYTGAGPAGLRLARDKSLAKRIVSGLGVGVPRQLNIINKNNEIQYPLLVKPRFGDGSDGIARHSLVRNARELRARVRALRAWLKEPALCEEYIPGRDLYVGLLGNAPRVLPPVELVVRSRNRSAPQFATYRLKNDPRYRARWRVSYRRARLDGKTMRRVAEASRRIFHALELRDYARLDFRLTHDNRLYFIEANPNPDLDPHALNRNGCFAGVPYVRLIGAIVESARKRGHERMKSAN